jgi:hypothetical protein
MKKTSFFLVILAIVLIGSFTSAEKFFPTETFGYGRTEDIPINFSQLPTVNASDYWITDIGVAGTVNATQFDINSGTLTIDESWLDGDWWSTTDAQTGLTGDKTGSFDLNTTGNLTVNSITIGSGVAFSGGSTSADTTMDFQANLNSGDDAFRLQFRETGSATSPTSGGYVQYNSINNYLEFGGIKLDGTDIPGFKIDRDTGLTTFYSVLLPDETDVGDHTALANLSINGIVNQDSTRLYLLESSTLGGYLGYDGSSNVLSIGTLATSEYPAIQIDRGSTDVLFLGDVNIDNDLTVTGNITSTNLTAESALYTPKIYFENNIFEISGMPNDVNERSIFSITDNTDSVDINLGYTSATGLIDDVNIRCGNVATDRINFIGKTSYTDDIESLGGWAKADVDPEWLIWSSNTTTGNTGYLRFKGTTATVGYKKGGITFERTGSGAIGSLHFLTDSVSDSGNVDLTNSRYEIDSDGNHDFKAGDMTTAGDIFQQSDTSKRYSGASDDGSIGYNGTAFNLNPREVGSGDGYLLYDWHVEEDLDVGGNINITGNITAEKRCLGNGVCRGYNATCKEILWDSDGSTLEALYCT